MAKVIVKLLSGKEITGNALYFSASKPTFHLQVEKEGKSEVLPVNIVATKAIHFLKKEESGESPLRTEKIDQSVFAGTLAFKLFIEFKDGEVLNGSTHKYNPNDKGFFLVPLNPADRSERIYINAGAVKHVDSKRLIGKILVDQERITAEQLEESLRVQKEQREKRIGAILREEKIISEKQLQESLASQKEKKKMLGEILLEAGYITSEQLEYALSIQRENRKKKLGKILVELKFITPNDICIALATQFHIPWVDLSAVRIPLDVARSLPEELIRRLEIIPVEKRGDEALVVAVSQPQDNAIRPEIGKVTPLTPEFVVAYEGYIESAIDCFFPKRK